MSHPFSSPPSIPGHGSIHLALLPPGTPRLRTVQYQYPLKLVAPAPLRNTAAPSPQWVHTVYVLSYGGGIVAGDTLRLDVTLDPATRLVLLTQGSTKLFRAPSRAVVSAQELRVVLAPDAALCFLPDPVQPFARSCFEQRQTYLVPGPGPTGGEAGAAATAAASLCVLDWVSNGRPANGENWSFERYASRTEVWLVSGEGTARSLLLRDSLVLDANEGAEEGDVARRMAGLAVYGTLIVYGPLMQALGEFFMHEFRVLPRIGGRTWDGDSDGEQEGGEDLAAARRAERHRRETQDGILWSAASLRGCVVVKVGAPELEHARRWLLTMLLEEGSVATHFGERALLCLR